MLSLLFFFNFFFMVLRKVPAVLVAPVRLTAELFVPSLSPQFQAGNRRYQHTRLGIPLRCPAAEGRAERLRAPCAGPAALPPHDGNEH